MFFKLLKHSWLSYSRAHFFEKSFYIKLLVGFIMFFILLNMLMAGMTLPAILSEIAPKQEPHEIILSALIFIMLADLLIRWIFQKIPAKKISPYFHYPVSKKSLAAFFIARAWITFFNVYLLIFFIPFFSITVITGISKQAFVLVIAGIIALTGLNHSFIFLLKTLPEKNNVFRFVLLLIIAAFAVFSWFYTEHILYASLWLGNSFLSGSPGIFVIIAALIIFLQIQSKKNLQKSFYNLIEKRSEKKISQKITLAEKIFRKIPVYGKYWNLEWKLINRNKRAKSSLVQWPLMLPLLLILFWWLPENNIIHLPVFLIFFAGSYGFFHLQFFLSWESRFFDFLASKNISFNIFIKAKFYFYSLLALVQFIILAPFILLINPAYVFAYISVMTYSAGVIFCILMYAGINHSSRIDPNTKAFFNFEGVSSNQFLMIALVFFSIIPFIITGQIIPVKNATYWVLLLSGVLFWALHPVWIKKIVNNFIKKKYIKLEKFRKD